MKHHDEDDEGLRNSLLPQNAPKLPALFKELGLGGVSTQDKFKIAYADGTLKVMVKRKSGVAQTAIRNVAAGFRALTEFAPDEMKSKAERNAYIRRAVASGVTQQAAGEQFGLSQSMVNRIVNDKPKSSR
ncbi:hypothetical protein HMI48_09720 [Acidithiobacillus ferrooxidans]|uniref:hypothetical protein n=1 Tax=Acidithiobacillus ferrooxidans TaxID=920 RepID=UPI001C078FC5|nr:hypothetical protein [Acidithiobacillus ferrooxidans]MBU2774159.1 hypothetical protein [Acidithiobacillus ferrooxidans]